MRYHILDEQPNPAVEDIAISIALDIINKKYRIGKALPSQRELAESYETSRTVMRNVFLLLVRENVISERGRDNRNKYHTIPNDTAAVPFVLKKIAESYRRIENILRAMQFGGRETSELWRIKQIAYQLPRILQEKEIESKIFVGLKQENQEELLDDSALDNVKFLLQKIEINKAAGANNKNGISLEELQDKFEDMLNS